MTPSPAAGPGVDPSVLHAGARAAYIDAAWAISAGMLLALTLWTLWRAWAWRRRAERAGRAPRP